MLRDQDQDNVRDLVWILLPMQQLPMPELALYDSKANTLKSKHQNIEKPLIILMPEKVCSLLV